MSSLDGHPVCVEMISNKGYFTGQILNYTLLCSFYFTLPYIKNLLRILQGNFSFFWENFYHQHIFKISINVT